MKLALRIGSALTTVAALALAGCGGTETGNPTFTTELTLTATSTNETAVAVRSDTSELNVEAAWISLRTIELVPCSSDIAPLSQADHAFDLTADPPVHAAFESAVRDSCGVRLEIAPSASATPPELDGLSLNLRGIRSDGIPFEIRSTQTLDVTLETPSRAAFDARHLALGFDLATWFLAADVHGATATNGVAVIDGTTNAAVLTAFETNTSIAAALYVDADRDGVLDADELTPIATTR